MAEKSCPIETKSIDLSGIEIVFLDPEEELDHGKAMQLANEEASKHYEEYMLTAWYDRGRDLESPAHATEGPEGRPKDGYIHYALSHGASLMVDVADGLFVFFFTPVEW